MRRERLQQIEEYIKSRGFVTMTELCDEFRIAMPTVRKDIGELVSQGRIEKVYGGAKIIETETVNGDLHSFKNRENIHVAEKNEIARKAAAIINDGDVVYIDSGTTAASIAEQMGDKKVTVITPNLAAMNAISHYENAQLYLLGGKLNKETKSVDSMFSYDFMSGFNIDKAFMAATGYSFEGGIAQDSPSECEIKRFVLSRSTESYLIIDSSKIGRKALVRYADTDDIENIITNGIIDEEYRKYFDEKGINII